MKNEVKTFHFEDYTRTWTVISEKKKEKKVFALFSPQSAARGFNSFSKSLPTSGLNRTAPRGSVFTLCHQTVFCISFVNVKYSIWEILFEIIFLIGFQKLDFNIIFEKKQKLLDFEKQLLNTKF